MRHTPIPRFVANTLRTLRSGVPLRAVLIALSLLLAFLSISPVSAATSVSGTISSNTTWAVAESPFQVTDDVIVASGVTLTIEPGVTVKFDSLKALDINGTLVAQGTSSGKITFTSSAASPTYGDWKFIRFNSSATSATFDGSGNYLSGSILQYCTVEYAGAGAIPSRVPAINGGFGNNHISVSPFIDHCTIQHNGSLGLYVDASPAAGTIRITNNLFNDNLGGGMTLNANADSSIIIENNTVTNSGGGNGIKFSVPGYGGAVTVTASVSNNFVSGNLGKGIWVSLSEPGQGTLTVSNNTIAGNAHEGLKLHIGGGADVYGLNNAAAPSTVIASNNTITDNGDDYYDAVWIKADACPGHSHQFSITDNTIFNNPGRGLFFESNQCWGDSRGNAVPSILTLSNNYIIQSGTALVHQYNTDGAALWLITLGPMAVTGNRIHNNGSSSAASTIYLQPWGPFEDGGTPAGSIAFEDNQISGNEGTLTIAFSGHHDYNTDPYNIERNSIHDNNTTNDFCSCDGSSHTWDLDDNWWGANSVALAESRIFHWTDDITFANVDFIPILTTPPTTAPPALPTNVAAQTGPTTIAFTWDANPESDIAGYKIHYDTDAAGYPYTNSSDVGNVCCQSATMGQIGTRENYCYGEPALSFLTVRL